jgi:hypothetical protein
LAGALVHAAMENYIACKAWRQPLIPESSTVCCSMSRFRQLNLLAVTHLFRFFGPGKELPATVPPLTNITTRSADGRAANFLPFILKEMPIVSLRRTDTP